MKILWFMMKLIAIALLTVTLVANRLLPIEILVAIGIIEIALLILVWKRKVLQIFVVLIMLVTASGLTYVEYVAGQIINYDPTVENTISFFVLKDSPVTSIKKAIKNESRIGVSSILDEEVVDFIELKLKEESYALDLVELEGIQEGLANFYDGDVAIFAVDQGYLSSLQAYDPLFLENTKVIWSINKTQDIINLTEANVTKEPFVVYLAGVDNRDEFQANRHDVNMLAVVDPKTRNITMVSLPRDAYVQLGCITRTKAMDKLTHAGVYGMECAIKTMQNLLGVDINYFAQVGFDTVTDLVGALGTIEVYLDEGFVVGGYTFKEGWNTLDKNSALHVARARHAFIKGDQQRIKNQQEVLKGIINKLLSPSSLTKIESIIKSVEGTVKTNMTGDEIFALVRMQVKNMKGWTFTQLSVEGTSATRPSYALGGQAVYVVDLNEASLENAKNSLQQALHPVVTENQ